MATSGSLLNLSEIIWVQFSNIVPLATSTVKDVLLGISNSLEWRNSVLIDKAWTLCFWKATQLQWLLQTQTFTLHLNSSRTKLLCSSLHPLGFYLWTLKVVPGLSYQLCRALESQKHVHHTQTVHRDLLTAISFQSTLCLPRVTDI